MEVLQRQERALPGLASDLAQRQWLDNSRRQRECNQRCWVEKQISCTTDQCFLACYVVVCESKDKACVHTLYLLYTKLWVLRLLLTESRSGYTYFKRCDTRMCLVL